MERTLTRESSESRETDILPGDGWIRFDPRAAGHSGAEGPLAYGPHVPEETGDPEPHIFRSVN